MLRKIVTKFATIKKLGTMTTSIKPSLLKNIHLKSPALQTKKVYLKPSPHNQKLSLKPISFSNFSNTSKFNLFQRHTSPLTISNLNYILRSSFSTSSKKDDNLSTKNKIIRSISQDKIKEDNIEMALKIAVYSVAAIWVCGISYGAPIILAGIILAIAIPIYCFLSFPLPSFIASTLFVALYYLTSS